MSLERDLNTKAEDKGNSNFSLLDTNNLQVRIGDILRQSLNPWIKELMKSVK
jgi:hypothetical protein